MEPWEGMVTIPEGEVNDYRIEHFKRPAGEVERSNMRTAMFRGQADPPLVFDRETTWHRLSYDGGVWMTDLPIEQVQHDQELAEMQGRVIVGGLGVGYAANVLAARESVTKVVVVEISPEVCQLVGPHIQDPRGIVEVVNADLFNYLREQKALAEDDEDVYFDWGFFDIWQSDGEGTFHSTVVPLRALAAGWVDQVVCWNESVMRGQLLNGLHTRYSMASAIAEAQKGEVPESHAGLIETFQKHGADFDRLATPVPEDQHGACYWNWSVPFWRSVRDGRIDAESFPVAASVYAMSYGQGGGFTEEQWDCWLTHSLEWAVERHAIAQAGDEDEVE